MISHRISNELTVKKELQQHSFAEDSHTYSFTITYTQTALWTYRKVKISAYLIIKLLLTYIWPTTNMETIQR